MAAAAAPAASHIRFVALGAGREIGRSCLLVDIAGVIFMLDCGVHMNESGAARLPDFSRIQPFVLGDESKLLPLEDAVNLVDIVVISHCHLDHVAALPHFVAAGYKGKICMTAPTAEIAPLLISDYNRVVRGKRNRNAPASTQPLPETSIDTAFKSVLDLPLASPVSIGVDGRGTRRPRSVQLTAFHAGHVLGAAMVHIQVESRTVLYTGDFNCSPEWHLPAASVPRDLRPQLMICESTLAVTSRHPTGCSDKEMLKHLDNTLRAGGRVLVPVYAVGRAQEVLLQTAHHLRSSTPTPTSAAAPAPPRVVMVEGLASSALELYQRHKQWCSTQFQELLEPTAIPADGGGVSTEAQPQTQKALQLAESVSLEEALAMQGPCVIFASPGMMGGGASHALLQAIVGDANALLLLPSFCVRGTLGEQILRGAKSIHMAGSERPVRCKVHNMSHSCHVDGPGILHTVEAVKPGAVLLVHGEEGKMAVLQNIVQKHLGIPAAMPANLEVLKL